MRDKEKDNMIVAFMLILSDLSSALRKECAWENTENEDVREFQKHILSVMITQHSKAIVMTGEIL